jgi:hypothetical protein
VAAIEFAMSVPVTSAMCIGAVELSQAKSVNWRVRNVASSIADPVARAEHSQTGSGDIMRLAVISWPASQSPLETDLTVSPAMRPPASHPWVSCTYKGLEQTQKLRLLQHHQEHTAHDLLTSGQRCRR